MPNDLKLSALIEELADADRLVRSAAVWSLIDGGQEATSALPAFT